jgi:hypothetical protein
LEVSLFTGKVCDDPNFCFLTCSSDGAFPFASVNFGLTVAALSMDDLDDLLTTTDVGVSIDDFDALLTFTGAGTAEVAVLCIDDLDGRFFFATGLVAAGLGFLPQIPSFIAAACFLRSSAY